jgi:hypothetical protein
MIDQIDKIIAFEDGTLGIQDTINLFAELVQSGQAWSLQGSYGRTAQHLIDNGYITRAGIVNQVTVDEALSQALT